MDETYIVTYMYIHMLIYIYIYTYVCVYTYMCTFVGFSRVIQMLEKNAVRRDVKKSQAERCGCWFLRSYVPIVVIVA